VRLRLCTISVSLLLMVASPLLAADYDASGTWTYIESNAIDSCGTAVPGSGTILIAQSGNTLTFQMDNDVYSGTVSGSTYLISGCTEASSAEITFTLASADEGSGVYDWTWSDCSDSCFGGADLALTRIHSLAAESDFPDYSGTYTYTTSNVRDSCPESGIFLESGTAVLEMYNNNVFIIDIDDREFTGTYSGHTFTYSGAYEGNGGNITETTTVQMTSENSGTGTTDWTWNSAFSCGGGHDLTLTRKELSSGGDSSGSGGGGGGGGCFIDRISIGR